MGGYQEQQGIKKGKVSYADLSSCHLHEKFLMIESNLFLPGMVRGIILQMVISCINVNIP